MTNQKLPKFIIQFQPTTQSVPQPSIISRNVGIKLTQSINPIILYHKAKFNLLSSNQKFVYNEIANRENALDWEIFKMIMLNGEKQIIRCKWIFL